MPNRIREYRERANLYQSDLGKALGVTAQAISKWELGKAEPDIPSILKMCDMFSVSADELLGRDPGIKKEAPSVAGLRDGLIDLLVDLSPEEEAQLRAFVAGMKANRKP